MMKPLTIQQQKHMEVAWRIAQPIIWRFHRSFPGPDYAAHVVDRLIEAISRYDPERDLRAWVLANTRGACLEAIRSQLRSRTVQWNHDVSGPWREDPSPEWVALEAFEALLRPLTPRMRDILSAIYRDNMIAREAAATLGISESRVSHLHAEAIERLRLTFLEAMTRSNRPSSNVPGILDARSRSAESSG